MRHWQLVRFLYNSALTTVRSAKGRSRLSFDRLRMHDSMILFFFCRSFFCLLGEKTTDKQ